MATRAERGPLPHKKGVNTGKKIATGIMAAIGIGGGVIGGMRIAEVGPFENSSPSQKHSQELIGGLPSVIATQTQLVESPTPTLTPEPTPSTGYNLEKDGSISYRTEKGEVLNVPQIPGLKAELQTLNGQQEVVYVANLDNPYGLKENIVSAVFYPETYIVNDSLEMAKQTGSIGISKELVRYFLTQSGSPYNKTITPLPFDLTSANHKKVLIQPTNTISHTQHMFLRIPVGTKFVIPIESQEDQPLTIVENQQNGEGTQYATIAIGYPAVFDKTYALNMYYGGTIESKKIQGKLGDTFFKVDADSFSTKLIDFYREHSNPPPLGQPNIDLGLQAFFTDKSGNIPYSGFGIENILSIDNLPTFIISNDNPLINPTK